MATPAVLQEQEIAASTTQHRQSPASWGLPLFFLLVTLATTTLVGMRHMDNFTHGRFPLSSEADFLPLQWTWQHRAQWPQGLPFSLTLLAILLAHEFAHYIACRMHGIQASLPYLIPAPALTGASGAIIRLHDPVRSRAALLWIGASGPIAGFLVATAVTVAGLALSVPATSVPQHLVTLNSPLLLKLLGALMRHPVHPTLLWHPVLLSGWVGLVVTSLNLIPAGQLDGGHVVYAISPRLHRILTNVTLIVLTVVGIFGWIGWLAWVALLMIPGMRHPKMRDETPLAPGLRWLAPVCLVIFLLTAAPLPFAHANLFQTFHWLTH